MDKGFRIDFVTHGDYEYLAAEISFRGQRLCQVFRRKDDDAIEIEFVEDRLLLDVPLRLKFLLTDFLATIEIARTDLLALKLIT